jgi:hypothetical protein
MKQKRQLLAMITVGLLLLHVETLNAEAICDKVRPIKPLRCVCGKLTDPTGGPVLGATVRVIKDGIVFATVKTEGGGNFVFDELKSGNYELDARLEGLVPFHSQIVVANPSKQCRRGLVILLVTSYPDNCGSQVVKIAHLTGVR